jgi:hypothetical protein
MSRGLLFMVNFEEKKFIKKFVFYYINEIINYRAFI